MKTFTIMMALTLALTAAAQEFDYGKITDVVSNYVIVVNKATNKISIGNQTISWSLWSHTVFENDELIFSTDDEVLCESEVGDRYKYVYGDELTSVIFNFSKKGRLEYVYIETDGYITVFTVLKEDAMFFYQHFTNTFKIKKV